MAKWTIPDMLTRAQADAMVAAALMRAANEAYGLLDSPWDEIAYNDILTLTTEDAQTALIEMLAEARAKGMREAAKIADERLTECEGMGLWLYGSDVGATILAAADAIQKEGEA